MIGVYVLFDYMIEVLELFYYMLFVGSGSLLSVIFGCVFRVCIKLIDLSNGRKIYGFIMKLGNFVDIMVSNTIFFMYVKCGVLDDVVSFF